MSPVLKIISLQWEGRDAYNFSISTVVSHIYAYDRAKTLSYILLIQRKSTEFENESNV